MTLENAHLIFPYSCTADMSFKKRASMVRWCENHIGPDAFLRGKTIDGNHNWTWRYTGLTAVQQEEFEFLFRSYESMILFKLMLD